MERQPPERLPTEDIYGVYCESCGFESYRGLDEENAKRVALGHLYVTQGHIAEIYEIDFNKSLGWVNQTRPSERQIEAIIDMSG